MANSSDDHQKPSAIWKLAETVSIVEAALLILEIEPQGLSDSIETRADDDKPKGYLAARKALESSIRGDCLEGQINYVVLENPNGGYEEDYQRIDYHTSQVDARDLARWLAQRGYSCSTFPARDEQSTGFRDRNHPRYAAKLAAVAEAWEAFDESAGAPGTPKQRLTIWLRLNAARFGLTGDDGRPMENVIEELAKVGNWATTGGAPKQTLDDPIPF
ncbi:hypothetical protein [Maricaulis sp.]|uniref:hypothetical protein n=1 Tax=Maricaulis sp. TaxID=1486257 RepID=UPI003A8E0E29